MIFLVIMTSWFLAKTTTKMVYGVIKRVRVSKDVQEK